MIPAVATDPVTDRLEQALELARAGRAAEKERELQTALHRYEDAYTLLAGLAPTPLLANVLRWMGSASRDLGRIDEADRRYGESLQVAEETGQTSAQASALNCRAVIAQRRGAIDEAVSLYRRASRLATEAGEIRLAGMIEQNLGVLANIRGDLDGALVRYRSALRAFQEVGDDEAASWVLNNMGMLLTDLGLPIRAERSFQRGLEIAERRRDRPMEGVLRTNYTETLIAMERWEEAETNLAISLRIAREGQERGREAEALKFQGRVQRARGDVEGAAWSIEEALRLAYLIADPLLVAESLRERGELRLAEGQRDRALEDFARAREGFVELDASLDADRLLRRIADVEREAAEIGATPDGGDT